MLVSALGVLKATGRPVPLLVVLGGPSGRTTAVRELLALASMTGVADDVIVHPPADRDTLARWYHAADVVAMPSRSESFGLVAAEAQASGIPVVAACVGGLRTIVDHDVSGRLVRGHDPAVWADVLVGGARLRGAAIHLRGRRPSRRRAVRLVDDRRPDAQGLLGGRRGPGVQGLTALLAPGASAAGWSP